MTFVVGYDLALPTAQNYAGIQSTIRNWLNRSDIAALVPDFITLAEEEMNRVLRTRQMEYALAATDTTDNAISVPADAVGAKSLWVVGHETCPLKPKSFEVVKANGSTGLPTMYAWQGSTFYFDGSGTIAGVLYQHIPVLSATNTTNWLLTDAPSAYLFGALQQAFDYVRDDAERDRWGSKFEKVLEKINGADMRDRFGGSLQTRAG